MSILLRARFRMFRQAVRADHGLVMAFDRAAAAPYEWMHRRFQRSAKSA